MYCHRVPEFPLDTKGELYRTLATRLTDSKALSLGEVHDLFSILTSLRRDLHAHPEPGFEEKRTHASLRCALTELAGVADGAICTCAGTGLVVDIQGRGPARGGGGIKTVALRADMDALRMTETNTSLPYRSTHAGVAHLCGHDGHMASLIGAAVLFQRKAADIPSDMTIRLLFQPAEEGPGGALPMIAEGAMDGVDEVYGYHNWPSVPLGHMWVRAGPVLAHPSEFTITIKGRGGHGSQPQVAVDPVLVAAHVIIALQSIASRSVHPREQAVVSVTTVHGGEVANVIPDQVTLTGTTRDLNPEVYKLIESRMRTIVHSTCEAYGASAEVDLEAQYAVVDNHAEQAQVVRALGEKLLGPDKVSEGELPILISEDFSYFMHEAPGAFFMMGGKEAQVRGLGAYDGSDKPAQRSNCMCHNTAFDFNDNLIPFAVCFWIRLIENRLGVALYTEDELPMGFGAEPQPTASADVANPIAVAGTTGVAAAGSSGSGNKRARDGARHVRAEL